MAKKTKSDTERRRALDWRRTPEQRTKRAANPDTKGLRPSERTPTRPAGSKPYDDSKDQYKGRKRALKKGEFPGEAVGGPKGSIYRSSTKNERAQAKADAVRKRMAKKKGSY